MYRTWEFRKSNRYYLIPCLNKCLNLKYFQLFFSQKFQRLKLLNEAWSELKGMAATRGQKLDESLTFQQFLAKVEEEEAWIR